MSYQGLKQLIFKPGFGYGNGNRFARGEHYFSQGMRRTAFGLTPGWNVTKDKDNTDTGMTEMVNVIKLFAEARPAGSMVVYGSLSGNVSEKTDIYSAANGGSSWSLAYRTIHDGYGNGLQGDPKNRLLYAGVRYLGKFDGTANYTTGTVELQNNNINVYGTGTTWTSSHVGKRIRFGSETTWYTIASVVSNTHITLTEVYIGSTHTGDTYTIYAGWDDQWKDFGYGSLASSSDFRPSDVYESKVLFGNGSKVAMLETNDDSFNASAFTFPTGFKVTNVSSGRTGVLFGVQWGNRSALVLWDTLADRSIAPWIWIPGRLQNIVAYGGNWIVITQTDILITNGYTLEKLAPVPDVAFTNSVINLGSPQASSVVGNYLFIANGTGSINRSRNGIWILDLVTRLWNYVPMVQHTINSTPYALFADSSNQVHFSWTTTRPNRIVIGRVGASIPTRAVFISEPLGKGEGQKHLEGVELNFSLQSEFTTAQDITFTVELKAYNFRRQLWRYGEQKVNATNKDEITVNGTLSGLNEAEIGDEVTIMEGPLAGESAHIVSITGKDTTTEVWKLDRELSDNLGQDIMFSVSPFQKVGSIQTVTNLVELRKLYFNCQQRYLGKQFLLKVVFSNLQTYVAPDFISGTIIYNDLGII